MILSSDTYSAVHFHSFAVHLIGSKVPYNPAKLLAEQNRARDIWSGSLVRHTRPHTSLPTLLVMEPSNIKTKTVFPDNINTWNQWISIKSRKWSQKRNIQFLHFWVFDASPRSNNFAYLTTVHSSPECSAKVHRCSSKSCFWNLR